MRVAEIAPIPHEDLAEGSHLSVSVVAGPNLSLWSIATDRSCDTDTEFKFQIQPDQAVVIGRQQGGRIEYLDERYQPTQLVPNSAQRVVGSHDKVADNRVSRGHFMLRDSPRGLELVNGVPRHGGGIRPPINGTKMLKPERRTMQDGEDFVIERGKSVTICLPNGTVIVLGAE